MATRSMEAALILDSKLSTVSVVVPVMNEVEHLANTLHCLHETLPPGSEIVVVDDGSTDGSDAVAEEFAPCGVRLLRTYNLGVARTRNHGARRTTGDVIIFADAHIDVSPGWWEPLVNVLNDQEVGAVGPVIASMENPEQKGFGYRLTAPTLSTAWMWQQETQPYDVSLLCGCFIALRRDVFEHIGGFDNGMVGWGSEDTELGLRLWLMGYTLMLVPQVEIRHLFRWSHPYPVDGTAVLHNALRMVFAHCNLERVARIIEHLKNNNNFADALARCLDSDIWTKRAQLAAERVRDDDWYFEHFDITI